MRGKDDRLKAAVVGVSVPTVSKVTTWNKKKRSVALPRTRIKVGTFSPDFAPAWDTVRLAAKVLRASSISPAQYSEALSAVSQTLAALRAGDDHRPFALERDRENDTDLPYDGGADGKRLAGARTAKRRPARSSAAVEGAAGSDGETATPLAPVEPQVRLIRRADILTDRVVAAPDPLPKGPRRSVVKWFDDKHRRGALHVPGIGGEVPISGAALDVFGLHRLFRGQEVMVEVAEENGTAAVVALALPSEPATPKRSFAAVSPQGRRRLSVVVEDKRKALQRVGAKLKAQSIFNNNDADDSSDD